MALGLFVGSALCAAPSPRACATLFTFPDTGAQVRVVQLDGNPWFVVMDVCRALGFHATSGSYMALKPLAADEKRTMDRRALPKSFLGARVASALTLGIVAGQNTKGQGGIRAGTRIATVSESGLCGRPRGPRVAGRAAGSRECRRAAQDDPRRPNMEVTERLPRYLMRRGLLRPLHGRCGRCRG